MNNNEKMKVSPEERVEKMNGIFDRLILPMIIFTAAVFIIFGLIPKIGNCKSGAQQSQPEQSITQDDFYSLRSLLLSDLEGNRSIFEAAGYTVMENGDHGELIAYRELESGAEIIDNLRDANGTLYSIIYRTDPETGIETNILIYGKSLFLVMLTTAESTVSAVFYSESFTADVSAADSGQNEVLSLVSAESMTALLEEYRTSLSSVVE